MFVVLWGTWGLFLAWLWLCVFSGRRSLLLALLMAAFGSLLNFQCWLGLDLFRLHYFGTAEQIMCSANASIPVLLFFIFLASGRMPLPWIPLLFAATAFYSPSRPSEGYPWRPASGTVSGEAPPLRDVLLHPSFSASVLLGACFLLYYGTVNAPSSHMGMRPFIRIRGFPAYGDLIPAVRPVLLAGFPEESPLYLYAGNRPDSAFFYVNGDVNDLLCKGSVPVMACLLAFLASSWTRHPGFRVWIWLLLAFGMAPRFNIPYYCCSSSALQAFLAPPASETEPSSFVSREVEAALLCAPGAPSDEWGRTMHHPGHRWYPYYSGTSRPWLRCIYRF